MRRGANIGGGKNDGPSDHRHHHQPARYLTIYPIAKLRVVDGAGRAGIARLPTRRHWRRSRAEIRYSRHTSTRIRFRIPKNRPTRPLPIKSPRTIHEGGLRSGSGDQDSRSTPTATPTPAGADFGGPERAILGVKKAIPARTTTPTTGTAATQLTPVPRRCPLQQEGARSVLRSLSNGRFGLGGKT